MKTKGFLDLFENEKPILGMIHLKGDTDKEVFERAKKEIDIYLNSDIDGIILENYFGNYYQLEKVIEYVKSIETNIPIGVNCLNVDAMGFELSIKYDLDFLQIDSVVGHVNPRDEATLDAFFKLYREKCKAYVIGGVRFKYQPILSKNSVEEDLKIATSRCDAIAVTGNATGEETSLDKIISFRKTLSDFPLIVAAGITDENIRKQLHYCDSAIVGSYFKDNRKDNGNLDKNNIKELMDIVNSIRKEKK